MNKIKSIINKNIGITALLMIFTFVYAFMMVNNHPWYDELYTYYSFISRGPFYSAIHWPLPNNHVGYSVLSGFLSYFGNATIALRGVSFVTALVNVFLVYFLSKRLLGLNESSKEREAYAILTASLYGAVKLVHTLSVQGRGYTLSTCLFLLSLNALLNILSKKEKSKIDYICYIIGLSGGCYVLPSSTFWVLPLCLFGGIFLLSNKRLDELARLVGLSLIAALIDVILYGVIWLAIGSNLLSKTEGSIYYGIYQITIIKKAPLAALKRGIDYMLASPYIQSIDRKDAITGLFSYLRDLFNQYYFNCGALLTVLLGITAIVCFFIYIKDRSRIVELFLSVMIISMPLLLIIEAKQPYLRVFSFFAFVSSLSLTYLLSRTRIPYFVIYGVSFLLLILLFTGDYNVTLGERENEIAEAFGKLEESGFNPEKIESIFYTDDYQKYVLKFYYNAEPLEADLENAEILLLNEAADGSWPDIFVYDDSDLEIIKNNYVEIGESGRYTVYKHK